MKSLNDPVEEESTEQSFCETAARKSTFSRCIRHSLKSKSSRVRDSLESVEAVFSNFLSTSVVVTSHCLTFGRKTRPAAAGLHCACKK